MTANSRRRHTNTNIEVRYLRLSIYLGKILDSKTDMDSEHVRERDARRSLYHSHAVLCLADLTLRLFRAFWHIEPEEGRDIADSSLLRQLSQYRQCGCANDSKFRCVGQRTFLRVVFHGVAC
jgi:hypothetical protein